MKELREKAGLTRAQLAEETGINFRTLEAYEQGRKDINGAKLKTLLKLCQALECDLEELITDPETKELLKLRTKKQMAYPAIFSKEANESEISVVFPDLGCATSGTDETDALSSASELLQCVLNGLIEDGEEVPEPSRLADIETEDDEKTVLIDVFMPTVRNAHNNRSVNRTVTLPAWLNAVAQENGVNFSQLLQDALKAQLKLER